jgi:hypothetical protein
MLDVAKAGAGLSPGSSWAIAGMIPTSQGTRIRQDLMVPSLHRFKGNRLAAAAIHLPGSGNRGSSLRRANLTADCCPETV